MHSVGDFEIIRELGQGAMSIVYEAIEKPLGRRVALKILRPEWSAQQASYPRFVNEARHIARLSHPSIVQIYRFGQIENTYFIALEYVNGPPLDQVLASEKLPLQRMLTILQEIAEALAHAHEEKIIHRDIKPGNLL